MQDNFYDRLDFYRMLNAGMNNLAEMAVALQVSVRTLQRWKQGYDPEKGPYGSLGDISVHENLESKLNLLDGFDGHGFVAVNDDGGWHASGPSLDGTKHGSVRSEIIAAIRQVALEGNVPAAKLLLSEYHNEPEDGDEVLTVERAVELLREWESKESRP